MISPDERATMPATPPAPDSVDSSRPAGPITLSLVRIIFALTLVFAVAMVVVFFADRAHLEAASSGFKAKPLWLLVFVAAYTGAFLLRAVAWRVLVGKGVGMYRLFVAIQASLLVNHLLPFN